MRKLSVILFCLILAFSVSASAENLIYNSDFSRLDDTGLPVGWYTDVWAGGHSRFSVVEEDGNTCILINSAVENDASLAQLIDVEPDTLYVFRARVKAENCSVYYETSQGMRPSRGANISILRNHEAYSGSMFDTEGEWVELELYGVTDSTQDELVIALRLGGYSGDTAGKAWFTDVSFAEAEWDDEIFPVSFATIPPANSGANSAGNGDASAPKRITETLVLIGFGVLLAGLALLRRARVLAAHTIENIETKYTVSDWLIPALLGLMALAARLLLAGRVRGYAVDIDDFMIWGEQMAQDGLSFYERTSLHDYPPLYMITLGVLSLARRLFGISAYSSAHVMLVKLVPICCDLVFGFIVYALARRRIGRGRALLLLSAVLFNPAYLADSAAWGQVDSVMTLMLIVCVYFAVQGHWRAALPCYALSMLIKPQAALFGPIGLLVLAIDAILSRQDKKRLKGMLHGLLIAVGIVYAVCAPFALHAHFAVEHGNLLGVIYAPFAWAWEMFLGATNTYRMLSVNACNLYVLWNYNWAPMENHGALTAFAWICFGLAYVVSGALCVYSRSRKALPLAGAVLISLIFCFAPMMHERYLFPVLALLVIAYLEYRDWRLLVSLLAFTLTQYLNMVLVLQGGTVAAFASNGHLSGSEQVLNACVSLINILSALWLTWSAFGIVFMKRARPLTQPAPDRLPSSALKRWQEKGSWRMNLRRADYLFMAVITALYSIVAFVNLGSTKAPQSAWKSSEYSEKAVIDLGETRVFRLTYFGGISDSTFTVALSNDGEHWTEEANAGYGGGEILRWNWFVPKIYSSAEQRYVNATYDPTLAVDTGEGGARINYPSANAPYPLQSARYVRITSSGFGLPINEIGFWDVDNETLYPVASVTGSVEGANYAALIDEQDTVVFTPSWFNGSYFDEIYFPRTAYELLHGESVFEWSHPHLGKLIMALGIQIFGMTPFGWRFTGALMGVIMLPVMYLLIMQLTKKSKLAMLGTFLLSVDSMHFTQTRLATIDSYPVLFIMLMYLFMFRYFQMNMHREKLWRTLIPLGLSGFFMGCACASKWIGVYASAGLAVIFFLSVALRLREYLALRKTLKEGGEDEEMRAAVKRYPLRLIVTLTFCVAAFIVVPLLIYYFSYYPHYAPRGGLTVEKVWNMQVQMFNFHSGLGNDTHYFRSPWYEWPLIVKPMWYYDAGIQFTGRGVVSSISCMGNPAVWWSGLAALIVLLILLCVKTRTQWTALLIAIGFASQFLPWVLVPRSTFIYHYFASVPFIILAIVWLFGLFDRRCPQAVTGASLVLASVALTLFVMFYPLESGTLCSYQYALHLRWFNWYNFQPQ